MSDGLGHSDDLGHHDDLGQQEGLGHQLKGTDGEIILLLNGGMMSYTAWAPITAGLRAHGYRVLGCDFRGQMRSPGDAHPRLEEHALDVLTLLDTLGLNSVHVLGTSFGGEVGLLLAALHPTRVRTLTAVTAVDRTPPGMAENSREMRGIIRDILNGGDHGRFHDKLVKDIYSAAWRAAHAEELKARRAQLAELPHSFYRGLLGILACIEDFDLTPQLSDITCPTLVVHATDDTVMPAERVRALLEAISGAELRVHLTAGHVLVMEDPPWVVREYIDFLARHGASPAVPRE